MKVHTVQGSVKKTSLFFQAAIEKRMKFQLIMKLVRAGISLYM